MRLRRETGDFSVTIGTEEIVIRKNLKAEDLIGLIIVNSTSTDVVTSATTGDDAITLTAGSNSYTYTPSTGEFKVAE